MVDRQGIHEQGDQAPKELQGNIGSAKIARHEANMCRAPLCSSPCWANVIGDPQEAVIVLKKSHTINKSQENLLEHT